MASEQELENHLLEVGNKLVNPPATTDELLQLLSQVESCLMKVEQSPSESTQVALSPLLKALVADNLLRHSDVDVKVAVAACLSEITRISAPDAPYDDDQMREVFQLIVSSFENLSDKTSQSYGKRMLILDTVAKVRSCVVMLDLECDALIVEMFQHFLKAVRDYHPENVFSSMETIMTLVLEESEEISPELFSPLLDSVKKANEKVLPVGQKLADKVLKKCAAKIKIWLVQAVNSLGISVDDYSEVVASICQERPDASEQNVTHDASDQPEKGTEVASSEPLDPAAEKAPKPVISNGITQAVDKGASKDASVSENQDQGFSDLSKTVNASSKAESEGVEKVEHESKSQEITRASGRETSSFEIPDVPHIDNYKDNEKELDNETQEKQVPGEPGSVNSQEKEVPEVSDEKAEDKEVLNEPDGDKTLEKEVPEVVSDDKAEDKEVLNEPDGDKTLEKEVPNEPNGDENLVNEVFKESDSDKTPANEVAVSPENIQGKENPNAIVNQEAEEEVPNSTLEKTKEKEVLISSDNEQDEGKDVPSSSDSERTLDDEVAAKMGLPTENENENTVQSSSPKELENQTADEGMLSPIKNLNLKSSKKAVRSNKNQSLKETAVPVNDGSKKDSEATSDLGGRPRRHASKKAPVGVSGGSKIPLTVDVSKERKKGDAEFKQKLSGLKANIAKSSAKGDGKKSGRGKVVEEDDKKSASEDEKSCSEEDVLNEMRSSSNSSKKSSKNDRQLKKTPAASSKGKQKASDVKEYGENLVGARIKVLWPDDDEYYPGEVESFDPVKEEHKVNYDDGDVEILKLKDEKWEFIKADSESDEEKTAGLSSPDASSERPQKKKLKSSHGLSADGVKGVASSVKDGVSSSKSKGTFAKSGTKSVGVSNNSGGKMKGKAISRSNEHSAGRSKDRKSGSKTVNVASKTDKKLKDDSIDTPKTIKSKNADTVSPKTSKPKQDSAKTTTMSKQDPPAKLKGKRPRSSGKSDLDDDTKLKSLSSKAKKSKVISDPPEGPDQVKGRSPKSSNARKRQKLTKN